MAGTILSISVANADEAVFGSKIRPGHVIILTENGFQPSIRNLLPDIPFSEFKAYESWQVKNITECLDIKHSQSRATSNSLLDNIYILTFPDTTDVRRVLSQLHTHPGIRFAEPDYKLELYAWPADSLFSQQWYLHNTGQEFYAINRLPGDSNDVLYIKQGKPGEDVNLGPIFDNPPEDSISVLVAIIDTGIDYIHPDLADRLYVNPGEIPGNGADDDHNGLIDDYRGWDFSGDSITVLEIVGDNDATDSIGHGTHVGGLVAAIQNEIGIVGYPGRIELLPVKIFPNGYQSVSIAAIIYASDMGAKIMNLSWGFPYESNILRVALQYATLRGCIPVAAAGNFGHSGRTYPASFPETFCVGGTNSDGFMTFFSTYGPFLDIVAPGRNILSLRATGTDLYYPGEPDVRIIDEKYILADGTSMSAPLVAGAAAMLWSFNPGLDPDRIMDILRQSADDMIDPWDQGMNLPGYDTLSGWGRLNVGRAFAMAQAPSVYISSPVVNEIVTGSVNVRVGTTGGYDGPADLYLGEGLEPDSWTLLYHSEAVSDTGVFYLWDSNGLQGYYSFRLESPNGIGEIDFRVINGNMVEITSPTDDEVVKYLINIEGSAYGLEYDSAVISYRSEGDVFYNRLATGTRLYFDEQIFEWPIYSLEEGNYILKLTAFSGQNQDVDSVRILVESAMRSGFPLYVNGYAGFSPGVADIDGDGYKEIALGCQKGLYAFNHDGTLMDNFPVLTDKDMRSIPAFDDIDGDGILDIITIGQNVVGCYNYLGQALPGWPKEASTGMTFSSHPIPVPTELFDREDSVIIYMSKYGEIHAYKFTGDPYFYSLGGLFTALDPNIFDTANFAGLSLPFVTATDLDGTGNTEVISSYSTSMAYSGVYVWDGRNGLPPYDWDTPLAKKIHQSYGSMLADVDDNGSLEIVLSGVDTNSVVNIWVSRLGQEDVPGWPVALPDLDGWIGTSPVCADVDGDGSKEIVVAYFNYDVGRVYAFNNDGTPYIENPALPYGMLLGTSTTLSNVIIADIDGNGTANILSRGGYVFPNTGFERIFAWEPNGDVTPGFPIVTPTPIGEVVSTPFTPVVDDLENDGKLELIMAGDNRNLFVWDLEVPYDSALMIWPKYLRDIRNSGINPNRADPTDVDDDIAVAQPNRFAILGNFPNPFNPATRIEFSLERSSEIKLEIFNILGQKVTTLISGRHPAGVHEILWDGTDHQGDEVASGVYFARLTGENDRQSTRKMMLLR
jgi:hypothetical protein